MKSAESRHIALFLPSLGGGGAERVTVTLANEFAKKGLKVDLLLAQAVGHYRKDVLPQVRVVDFKSSRVLKTIPKLARYLSTEKPACLLSALNHANIAAVIAHSLARNTNTRLVVAEHTAPSYSRSPNVRDRALKALATMFYRRASCIVAVSEGVAADLCKRGVSRAGIKVIHNPIVSEELITKAAQLCPHPWLQPKGPPVILAVGRLEPAKDFATLISAFYLLRQNRPAKLVILGEGRLRETLTKQIVELGLQEDVELPGFVDNPFSYMSRAAVFALSSTWEGLPTVLVEALWCGASVVSTDCPYGPREILDGGKLGTLVPVGDAKAIAAALEAVVESPRSVRNVMALVEARFSVTASAHLYEEASFG
jgi:glycosyltransferase involved in cell wall biosynthesis